MTGLVFHVINLHRSPERWAALAARAAALGLTLERVEAVDGRVPGALAGAGYQPDPRIRHSLKPAEVACFESHKRAWKRIASGAAPFAAVLEDDVLLARGIGAFLEALIAAPHELDLVKLNAQPRGTLLRLAPLAVLQGRSLRVPVTRSIDASAYLISRSYAARALEQHATYSEPLDRVLFDPELCPALAHVDPALTVQAKHSDLGFLPPEAARTTIQTSRKAPSGPGEGPLAKAGREARRFTRRRLMPLALPVLNAFRRTEERLAFRRVPFRE